MSSVCYESGCATVDAKVAYKYGICGRPSCCLVDLCKAHEKCKATMSITKRYYEEPTIVELTDPLRTVKLNSVMDILMGGIECDTEVRIRVEGPVDEAYKLARQLADYLEQGDL